ncbi:MAG: chemotaxis protein CheW [Wenzhouxiangellaceae bacterium]|nr:chemotaxis protein CheW [Wenzhouxiangellaceae bacterium]
MAEKEIRSVLVPMQGLEILLPNASVAEIIAYATPEALPDTPNWLLGNLLWQGWKVPVISLAMMLGKTQYEGRTGARICITKSLIGNPRMPYLGLLTQGFPRLITITEANLTEVGEPDLPAVLAGRALIGDRDVMVPDLDTLAEAVARRAHPAAVTDTPRG